MPGQPRDLRGLKILVAVLGVLVVLGTTLVIGIIIRRIYAPSAVASTSGEPQSTSPAIGPVMLPAGTRITGVAAGGGEIAVITTGPAGDQLWLVNPQTGARIVTMSAPK